MGDELAGGKSELDDERVRVTASPGQVAVEFDVPARMRDGVVLRADVYRPVGRESSPTLLTRTPYGKATTSELGWSALDPVRAARAGFMVIIQDTRGRFASEGVWDPFRYEQADGYDSVEWAASLPGSNGKVGMFGGSYHGNTQLLAAIAAPSSLAAISPAMTWSEPLDGLLARGGAIEVGMELSWALLCGLDDVERREDDPASVARRLDQILDDWDALGDSGYWRLPIDQLDTRRAYGFPGFGSLADATETARLCRIAGAHERIQVPSLHMAGWYDVFLQGTLDNYKALARTAQDARLVVGPWTHERFSDPIGEQVFGIRSSRDSPAVHEDGDWNSMRLAWLRRQLERPANEEPTSKPVRIFVMGLNQWRDEDSWPPADATAERWFLHPEGGLSQARPESSSTASRFAYDPHDPVPTRGGNTLLWSGFPAGPIDQRQVEERPDVLGFTSEVLASPFEVTGRVSVSLHARSSAMSTDWVARLCDVHPDGRSFNLCDGIVRAVAGADQDGLYEVDLWSTSNVFLEGHRIRVQITSSSFPRWDRNLNTGDQRSPMQEVAHQQIFHDGSRASHITLPVIRRRPGKSAES